MPTLIEDEELEAEPVYAAALPDDTTGFFEVAWIDMDRKLILNGANGEMELFDLASDPGETTNLLEDDPEAAADLVEGLTQYYRERGMDPSDYSLGD